MPAANVAPAKDCENYEADAEDRALDQTAGPNVGHVDPDHYRNRDSGRDRRGRPRAMLHRVDDDQPEHGDKYHHDHQHADQRGKAGDGADLVRRHAPERTAVTLERVAEDDEILDAAAEYGADDDPQSRRQVTKLRGEDRTDERSGAGDRCEVMAEGDPFWSGHIIAAVVQADRGSDVSVIELEHAIRDEARVEPVAERIDADCGDDEPQYARVLAAR